MITYILAIISAVLVLVFDQLTKMLVMQNFTLYESHDFINGLLRFTYIHNDGGAWGIFSGNTALLVAVTAIVMIACIYILVVKARRQPLLFWAITLTLSGGLGNMIDRIFRGGHVIDFLQFDFWRSFPVFNIADCAIVIGCGLLILYFVLDWIKEAKEKNAANRNQG